LVRAVEVAIAAGDLPPAVRRYGKTALLEVLAETLGLARNALRNLYYRDEARLELVLHGYVAQSQREVSATLRKLEFHNYSPIVWKRPLEQLRASWDALDATVVMVQAAEKRVRESPDAPIELRREVGTVAAEIMACALTFYDGRQRLDMLREAERIFLSAMSPVSMSLEVEPADAALFAKFWENRATICGVQWSNIWDDPSLPPTIDDSVLNLALRELDRAAEWERQHGLDGAEGERRRQLLADKAKWFAKAGRFEEAHRQLAGLSDFVGVAALSDSLLIRALEAIAGNRLADAARIGGELSELIGARDDAPGVARVTSQIMVHNIELLRGKNAPLPDEIAVFLRDSPVVASEMVNLPRYRARLDAAGYASPATAN
jgi:hypothetical protein